MEVKRNLGRCASTYSFPVTNLYNQTEPDNSPNQIGQTKDSYYCNRRPQFAFLGIRRFKSFPCAK